MGEVLQEPGNEGFKIIGRLLAARSGMLVGFFFGLFLFFFEIIGDQSTWQLFVSTPLIFALVFGLLSLLGGNKRWTSSSFY
jgi:hypothetical protein